MSVPHRLHSVDLRIFLANLFDSHFHSAFHTPFPISLLFVTMKTTKDFFNEKLLPIGNARRTPAGALRTFPLILMCVRLPYTDLLEDKRTLITIDPESR